jgi:hypothetical protein
MTCTPSTTPSRARYDSFRALQKRKIAVVVEGARPPSKTFVARIAHVFVALREGWTDYRKMSIFRPALALALLYCTVLSFGSLLVA